MSLPATSRALLEKAAVDNGFDRPLPADGDWLGFASSHAPLRLWLAAGPDRQAVAAMSMPDVARALAAPASPGCSLPAGAAAACLAPDHAALHRLVRRAFQLSRALPDEPLRAFESQTGAMPRATEAERLVIQRVGQDIYRARLLEYWEGRCAITGLSVPELLRASHIKPWARCDTDAERLDVFNGLLLAPHLDAAFDGGFIMIADDGTAVTSPRLAATDAALLGLGGALRLPSITDGHRRYLEWHRGHVFRG